MEICAGVHRALPYRKGATSVGTTAAQAFAIGSGVCQDQAHVMLAMCRALGMPARYVSGHLLGEGLTHAWVEVILPHPRRPAIAVAVPMDPCHGRLAGATYVTVAVGRDYDDVAPTSGTYVGPHRNQLTSATRLAATFISEGG
jgi:transglutaminase-like putative cysteine protease